MQLHYQIIEIIGTCYVGLKVAQKDSYIQEYVIENGKILNRLSEALEISITNNFNKKYRTGKKLKVSWNKIDEIVSCISKEMKGFAYRAASNQLIASDIELILSMAFDWLIDFSLWKKSQKFQIINTPSL